MHGEGRENKNEAWAVAEADDLRHAMPFAHPLEIRAGGCEGWRNVELSWRVCQHYHRRLSWIRSYLLRITVLASARLSHSAGDCLSEID